MLFSVFYLFDFCFDITNCYVADDTLYKYFKNLDIFFNIHHTFFTYGHFNGLRLMEK